MNYTEKLQKLRIEANLSQGELASILNIARQTYNHYEIQENVVPIKHLNNIANYFNVSIDFILNLTNERNYQNSKSNLNNITSGTRLTEFRKENKITQEKLATFLNTNKSVICNYEKGRNIIPTPFLYDICKKYKISADYLLGKIDEPKYIK